MVPLNGLLLAQMLFMVVCSIFFFPMWVFGTVILLFSQAPPGQPSSSEDEGGFRIHHLMETLSPQVEDFVPKKALGIICREEPQMLVGKKRLMIAQYGDNKLQHRLYIRKMSPEGTTWTEYIERWILHQGNSQPDWAIIPVQPPTHVCVLFLSCCQRMLCPSLSSDSPC